MGSRTPNGVSPTESSRWVEEGGTVCTPGHASAIDVPLARDGFERIATALESLPPQWRSVLWHAEIMDNTAAGIAVLMNLEPEAAIALLDDAREGFRTAYRLADPPTSEELHYRLT